MLGYSDSEIKNLGENVIAHLMHPEDFGIYLKQTYPKYELLPDNELLVHEFRMKDKKGEWHWLLAKESIHLRNDAGTPKQIFGVATDITERKKDELALKETSDLLRSVFDSSLIGFSLLEAIRNEKGEITDFCYKYASRATERMNNRTDLPGKVYSKVHSDFKKVGLFDMFKAVVESGQPGEMELFYQAEGFKNWFQTSAVKLGNGVMLAFEDITIRKTAEQKVYAEKEISDSIINSLPGIFYLYNKQGKFFRWNKNFEKISGYSAEEIGKMHPLDFFDNPDKELLSQKIQNVFLNGEDAVEADFLLKSGGKIPHYFTGRSIDYYGEPCLMGVGIDISERVAAQQLLQDTATELSVSEKKYRLLFESNPLPLWIYSKESLRFIAVNNAAIEHYGYSKAEFLKMTLKDIRPEEDIPLLMESLSNDDRAGKNENKVWSHYKKDGSLIQVEIRSHDTIFNNEPVRLALVIDVTEKLIMDKKINDSLEAVRRLTAHIQSIREEERKRIGREIHDELGQQLTAIKMDVAWIDKKTPTESEQVKLKLKNIITLLDSSNLSIRKILNELRMGILEHQSIEEALRWQGQQFSDNTGIPIEFNCPKPITKTDEMVATCLFRVFQESLTNITRYAKAKKVITWLTQDEQFVSLSIEDDGKGFDASQLRTTKSFGILGMKERVASLNGKFELITAPGKGTRIEIKIPVSLT